MSRVLKSFNGNLEIAVKFRLCESGVVAVYKVKRFMNVDVDLELTRIVLGRCTNRADAEAKLTRYTRCREIGDVAWLECTGGLVGMIQRRSVNGFEYLTLYRGDGSRIGEMKYLPETASATPHVSWKRDCQEVHHTTDETIF